MLQGCVSRLSKETDLLESSMRFTSRALATSSCRKDNFLKAALKKRPLCFPWMKRAGSQDPVRPWVDVNSIWMLGDIFEMRIAGAAEFYGYN